MSNSHKPEAVLTPASTIELSDSANIADAEAISAPTYLVTEGEVMLGSAAALSTTPAIGGDILDAKLPAAEQKTPWYAGLARMFTTTQYRQPRRRHYPSRYDYTTDARMARAMERL
jgi:hypothetical protein